MIDMMDKIFKAGELYEGFMNALLEASRAAFEDGSGQEERNGIFDQMTQRCMAFYEKSVGRFLSMPQLGLSRESLQQMMAATDSYYRFTATIEDFLVKFNIPLKDAWETIIKTVQEREGTGRGFESAKEIYDVAVEILDEKYDAHIKSPQGVQIVVDLVEKYLDFKKKSDAVKDLWFRSLSLPTSGDMNDVYRGIYELRKKTRKQETIIREHEALIENLNQRLLALEASLADVRKRGRGNVLSESN